jgi:glutamate dehydrogenase
MELRERRLREAGVPESLAARVASSEVSPAACDVARCARVTGVPVERVGQVYFSLGEDLGFDRLREAAAKLQITSPWQQEAVTATVDDLASHQAELTRGVVLRPGGADTAISGWSRDQTLALQRLTEILQDFEAAPRIDLPMLTIAEHELRRLVELSDPEARRRPAAEPVDEE